VASRAPLRPRNFFLNEKHELSPVEKGGGGRLPDYVQIAWSAKSRRIGSSIERAIASVQASKDPLRDDRFFLVAKPVAHVEKRSTNRKKAPNGTFEDPTSFGGIHGKVFGRLGLDLIDVTDDGLAVRSRMIPHRL
jgi:hypothetical protein